ncbi:hypothetical protein SNA_11590 [Streptomyces natalensis ATCC 27448]|uniref:Uncharacterized protein n=1 Tax=Streptomyces natalensis ATCC 27448 TaxID=1240678 RepID=A0A0D7CP47_9ACTN|nr:hypothetical protein SNA_11590 [Streptomyces natalensis ATCC 27448]
MRTRQGIAAAALLASLCVAWIMVVVAVVVPGEQTLLIWAGIALGTGTAPMLVIIQRRRAAEAAYDEAYLLGLKHAGPDLLRGHPPSRRQGADIP